MDWSIFSIASVVSGIACVVLVAVVDMPRKERLWAIGGGAATAAWGLFEASQSSGLFYFSPLIFVIPFLVLWAVVQEVRGRGFFSEPASQADAAAPRHTDARLTLPMPAKVPRRSDVYIRALHPGTVATEGQRMDLLAPDGSTSSTYRLLHGWSSGWYPDPNDPDSLVWHGGDLAGARRPARLSVDDVQSLIAA